MLRHDESSTPCMPAWIKRRMAKNGRKGSDSEISEDSKTCKGTAPIGIAFLYSIQGWTCWLSNCFCIKMKVLF